MVNRDEAKSVGITRQTVFSATTISTHAGRGHKRSRWPPGWCLQVRNEQNVLVEPCCLNPPLQGQFQASIHHVRPQESHRSWQWVTHRRFSDSAWVVQGLVQPHLSPWHLTYWLAGKLAQDWMVRCMVETVWTSQLHRPRSCAEHMRRRSDSHRIQSPGCGSHYAYRRPAGGRSLLGATSASRHHPEHEYQIQAVSSAASPR